MAEDAAVPAAKLQKAMDGDVTNSKALGPTAQPGAINPTPEDTAADPITGVSEDEGVASRIPIGGKKRKVALYIAYIGAGYYGMQRNPGYPSIEGELEKAICKAGGISAANADSFSKVGWMRAARTDKGVSAVGQVVSLKMLIEFPNYDLVANINKHLPDQIRVLGYTKVTAGFDARKHCDKRRYEYVLPAWAFDPNACRSRISAEETELAAAAQLTPNADAETALPGPPPRLAAPSPAATAPSPSATAPAAAQPSNTIATGVAPQAPSMNVTTSTAASAAEAASPAGTFTDAVAEATALAVASDAAMPSIPDTTTANARQQEAAAIPADPPQPNTAAAGVATGTQSVTPSSANTVAANGAAATDQASHAHSDATQSAPYASAATGSAPLPAAAAVSNSQQFDQPAAATSISSVPEAATLATHQASEGSAANGAALIDANSPGMTNGMTYEMTDGAVSGGGFTFDAAATARLSSILKQYEGTHNFHNFTIKLDADDPSAKRYMLSCKCDGTFQIQGQPWVRIVIIGQSFMLHQIRKMVGMAVAIMRGDAPLSCIKVAFQPNRLLPTPMAPDVGLFLDECYYEAYNNRWGEDHAHVTLQQFSQRVAEFKANLMYPHIATTDAKSSTNATWLRSIHERSFHFSKWSDAKACKAIFGQRGERAIFNGDILPAPAGAASIVGGHESYGLGGKGRGKVPREVVSVGEKRPRSLQKPGSAANGHSSASIIDISLQHEYSD